MSAAQMVAQAMQEALLDLPLGSYDALCVLEAKIEDALRVSEDEALERAAKEAEKPLATCLSPEGPRCPKCEAIRFAARCIRSLKSSGGTR